MVVVVVRQAGENRTAGRQEGERESRRRKTERSHSLLTEDSPPPSKEQWGSKDMPCMSVPAPANDPISQRSAESLEILNPIKNAKSAVFWEERGRDREGGRRRS